MAEDKFVGRTEELRSIKEIISTKDKGIIIVLGKVGIGKTGFLYKVKEKLSETEKVECGIHRVESRLEEPFRPYLLVLGNLIQGMGRDEGSLEKFREALNDNKVTKVKRISKALFKDLANLVKLGGVGEEVAEILFESSEGISEEDTIDALLVENKPAIITTYLGLVRSISERFSNKKFVMVFDQVENASESFQEFMLDVANNLPNNFHLIFSVRTENENGEAFIQEYGKHYQFLKAEVFDLPGLSNLEIRELIENIKGTVSKDPSEIEEVRKATDGRPLLIIPWIQSEDFDKKIIDKEKLRLYGYFKDRFDSISKDEGKKLARICSCLPFSLHLTIDDYCELIGMEDNFACQNLIEELEKKSIFKRYGDESWFAHELIKNYIFENLGEVLENDSAVILISYLSKKIIEEEGVTIAHPLSTAYTYLLPYSDNLEECFERNLYLGQYHYRISSYITAKGAFERALISAEKIGDNKKIGLVLNEIGTIYQSWGEYDQALGYYERSLKIKEEIGDRSAEGATLNNIGAVYHSWGKYDQALEYYKRSLKIREEIGDRSGEETTLSNIGLVYDSWGKYDQALKYYERSLKISEEIGDRSGEGTTLNNIGLVYDSWGKYDQALEYYKRSLKIREEIGERAGEGATLNNIGTLYDSWGKYDQALKYYKRSLKIVEEIGDRSAEGATLNNIGGVYKSWGKYDQALEYYKRSLKIREEIGDLSGIDNSLYNIGGIYCELNKYEEAIEYFNKSMAIQIQIKNRYGEGYSLYGIGGVYELLGEYKKAIEYYSESLKIFTEIGAAPEIEVLKEAIDNIQSKLK